ncbi:MAG: DUF6062 family protein [Anaerolineae bacterium]
MPVLPSNYHDIIQHFTAPGCVICILADRDVNRFIDSHLYEYVNTPETHAALRASRGLCATHSARLVNYGASVLGITILHSAVMDELLKKVAEPARSGSAFSRLRGGSAGGSLADRLDADGNCLACDALNRAERHHVTSIAEHVLDEQLNAAYRASGGICLPHFQDVLRAAPSSKHVDELVSIQSEHWRKLKFELDELARKYDVNHAADAVGAEADSWRRALRLTAGHEALFGLRRR